MSYRLISLCLSGLIAGSALISAAPAHASEMTVQQFLSIGENVPRNRAAAMLKPETHRLISEVTSSVRQVRAEQTAAQAAGRRPAHCIPSSGTGITPETLVQRFETMPPTRRQITVTAAIRNWMVERHPCKG